MHLPVDNMDTDSINQLQMLHGLSEDEIPMLIRWVYKQYQFSTNQLLLL